MPTASFALTALIITLLVGGGLSAWLWWVHCPRLVRGGGIRALAAMRWREFSRFVIEALHAQGFEATRIEAGNHQAPEADLRLTRDNQTWLLNCRQGANSRITHAMVAELAKTVRITSADGGVLATLGRIEPEARRRHQGIELLDGATLWPLIDPLLPPSLHQELMQKARATTLREITVSWLVALAFGIVAAMALAPWLGEVRIAASPTATPLPAPAAPSPAAATAQPQPAPPLSEGEMRRSVEEEVTALATVETATWATRSTLLVHLLSDADQPMIDAICVVLERHEPLRASRLQLQPPPGSQKPVRFMQCRRY